MSIMNLAFTFKYLIKKFSDCGFEWPQHDQELIKAQDAHLGLKMLYIYLFIKKNVWFSFKDTFQINLFIKNILPIMS